jgi:hypothetical protein
VQMVALTLMKAFRSFIFLRSHDLPGGGGEMRMYLVALLN